MRGRPGRPVLVWGAEYSSGTAAFRLWSGVTRAPPSGPEGLAGQRADGDREVGRIEDAARQEGPATQRGGAHERDEDHGR